MIRSRAVKAWVLHWHGTPVEQRREVREAWIAEWRRVESAHRPWTAVKGTISSLQAAMAEVG